jgi:hypothetical protein
MQVLEVVAAEVIDAFPAEQAMQAEMLVAVSVAEYVPGGQSVHSLLPVELNFPAGHL